MTCKNARAWQLSKWLRRLGLALLIVYAGYLLSVNLLLNTPLASWAINRKPERFQMHWQSAWSWWPGRVRVWDVQMQGASVSRRWQVEAARIQARVLLWPLLRREVQVPQLQVEQLRVSSERVEIAKTVAATTTPAAASAPATTPATTPTTTPAAEVTVQQLHNNPASAPAWTLRFDRIVSDSLIAARFDELQVQGRSAIELGFVKRLHGGEFQLLSSTLDSHAARLNWKGEELLRDGRLHAQVAIAPYQRSQARGLAVLNLADIRLQLRGTTAALGVRHGERGRVQLQALPGQGQADLDLHWNAGRLDKQSRAVWQAPLTGNDLDGQPLQGALRLELHADEDLHVRLQLPPQPSGTLQADIDLRIRGRDLPLHDWHALLPRTTGKLSAHWRFDSLNWIPRLFPQTSWLSLDGAGLVAADIQLDDGKPTAGSRVRIPEVSAVAQVMGNRINGQAEADLRLEEDAQGHVSPRLSLRMRRFGVAAIDEPQHPFVQGNDLRLELHASMVANSVKDMRQSTRAQVAFRNAQVPDLRAYNRYLPKRQLRFAAGSGRLSGDFSVEPGGNVGHGWLRADASGARMHLADLSLRGDVGVDLKLRRAELQGERFVIDGSTVALRNISFSEPDGQTRGGWWANVRLQRARMQWHRPVSVEGSALIDARDVGFLLSLFSHQRAYPKWIYRVVDAGQARLYGRVHWRDDLLVLDRLQANNERFQLAGRLRLRGDQRDGSLYARWGVLDAALELDGQRQQWHLLHSRQWYDAQPDLLR